MAASASVVWVMTGSQAFIGLISIIGAYKYLSKDIEAITITFLVLQAAYIIFTPNFILPLINSIV